MFGKNQKADVRLALEEAEAAKTADRLAALEATLNAQLLQGNAAEIDKTDDEIERLRRGADRRQRTIDLLKRQIEAEKRSAAAKRQRDHAERLLAKFSDRDRVVTELEATIAKAVTLYRQAIEIGNAIGGAWPFSDSDLAGARLTGRALRELVCHQLYKAGTKPFFGGNPFEAAATPFPGGVPPDESFRLQPERIQPLSKAIAEASKFGADLIRRTTKSDCLRRAS